MKLGNLASKLGGNEINFNIWSRKSLNFLRPVRCLCKLAKRQKKQREPGLSPCSPVAIENACFSAKNVETLELAASYFYLYNLIKYFYFCISLFSTAIWTVSVGSEGIFEHPELFEPKAIYVHKVVRAPDIKIYIKVAGLFSIIFSWNHRGIRQIPS